VKRGRKRANTEGAEVAQRGTEEGEKGIASE
jgi:hypothetical protein